MALTDAQKLFIEELLPVSQGRPADRPLFLISCSKKKGHLPAAAAELYTSTLFRSSVALASSLHCAYFILSAKYGLLRPDRVVPPYDEYLADKSDAEVQAWGVSVAEAIRAVVAPRQRIIALSSRTYSDAIITAKGPRKVRMDEPLAGLSIGRMAGWVAAAARAVKRREAIERLYRLIKQESEPGGLPTLRELLAEKKSFPSHGIYLFFDPADPTSLCPGMPRLVRIGTHAVSMGSKSTLRNRLRTHLGTSAGGGNHRGSIFRLHVGNALINRAGARDLYPAWGKGQNATSHIRVSEETHEKAVSKHIAGLQVLVLEVPGAAEKKNLRSRMEEALIALFTADGIFVDRTSKSWLGVSSDRPEIARSGLWNIQHHGGKVDPRILKRVFDLVAPTQHSLRLE